MKLPSKLPVPLGKSFMVALSRVQAYHAYDILKVLYYDKNNYNYRSLSNQVGRRTPCEELAWR
jgi:hypothetical protein